MSDYNDSPMSTGAWFLTLLVLAIPLLNLIMYIVWACGVGNRSRVTFCRATILWVVIGVGLYIGIVALGFGAAIATQL
jgi:hypothetical protein